MTKRFNSFLTMLEDEIEHARQKGSYNLALSETGNAIGCIRLAYYLDLIDDNEFEKLFYKFNDYYNYYYDLVIIFSQC